MTKDYKKDAINNVITELYCDEGSKYIGKNRDLIERALFGDTEWCKLKDECNEKMARRMKYVAEEQLPTTMKKLIDEIYSHYNKFLEIQDIDKNTAETIMKIFKDDTNNDADFDCASSTDEEDSPKSPGRKIKKVKKLDTVNYEASKHLYTATTTRNKERYETMRNG